MVEQWYEQVTERFVSDEAFWPGEHKSYAQLEQDRNKDESDPAKLPLFALKRARSDHTYICITDAERLGSVDVNTEFPVTTLRHLTKQDLAERIFQEGGFRGSEKGISTIDSHETYSWWSVHYRSDDPFRALARVRADLVQRKLRELEPEFYEPKIEPSYPFLDRGIYYGNFAFTYDIHDMLEAYEEQYCEYFDLVLRNLGTFVYLQQIMYAVVVHSSEHDDIFGHLPIISERRTGNRLHKGLDGRLLWCPESIIKRNNEPYSPWERLCFAFHLPGFNSVLKLNGPRGHCEEVQCDLYNPKIAKPDSANQESAVLSSAVNEVTPQLTTFL